MSWPITCGWQANRYAVYSKLCLLLTVTKKGNEKSAGTLLFECYRSPLFTVFHMDAAKACVSNDPQVCKIGSIKSNIIAIISDRCTCNLLLLTLIAESSFRHFLREMFFTPDRGASLQRWGMCMFTGTYCRPWSPTNSALYVCMCANDDVHPDIHRD